jgi:hypothetical protein
VHPSKENDVHELYLMCGDVEAFAAAMREHGISCTPVQDLGWGRLTRLTLPGGGALGVYQPRHARPKPMRAAAATPSRAARTRLAASRRKTAGGRRSAGSKSARGRGAQPASSKRR